MKTLKQNYRGFMAVAAVSITLLLAAAGQTNADPIHNYYHPEDRGYYDEHHSYHHFDHYNNHRGYYTERGGARIFIQL